MDFKGTRFLLAPSHPLRPSNRGWRKPKKPVQITLATNNGRIGGGEVMLLNIATALTTLGVSVQVLAPTSPSELAERATRGGIKVIRLEANSRISWMWAIRNWRRHNSSGVIWCNGLLPAVATSFMRDRIVHLHQVPTGFLALLAPIARWNALATLVPSKFMAAILPGARVLTNWVEPVKVSSTPFLSSSSSATEKIRIGFIGRVSIEKGVDTLVQAFELLESRHPSKFSLVIAGEPLFASKPSANKAVQALNRVQAQCKRLGWVTTSEFFSQVDILVCPSSWQEPFGLVLAEAMSARRPIVATRVGAIPEVCGEDYEFLSNATDAKALAKSIENLSSATPQKLVSIVDQMQLRWKKRFSPESGENNLRVLLNELNLH